MNIINKKKTQFNTNKDFKIIWDLNAYNQAMNDSPFSVDNVKIPTNKPQLEPLHNCDIIVLEDEILSAALIEKYIKSFIDQKDDFKIKSPIENYSCRGFSSGWDLLHKDLSNVKIAIVDLLLPQITGVDLIKDFLSRHPHIGILPISGMATSPMKRKLETVLPQGIQLVEKPLRKKEFFDGFLKAIKHNQQPQLEPQERPKLNQEENGESMWTEVYSNPNIKIPTVRRKLVRRLEKTEDEN